MHLLSARKHLLKTKGWNPKIGGLGLCFSFSVLVWVFPGELNQPWVFAWGVFLLHKKIQESSLYVRILCVLSAVALVWLGSKFMWVVVVLGKIFGNGANKKMWQFLGFFGMDIWSVGGEILVGTTGKLRGNLEASSFKVS